MESERGKLYKNSSLSFYPETSTKNSVQEFHLRTEWNMKYEMVSFLPPLSSVIRNLIWILLFQV